MCFVSSLLFQKVLWDFSPLDFIAISHDAQLLLIISYCVSPLISVILHVVRVLLITIPFCLSSSSSSFLIAIAHSARLFLQRSSCHSTLPICATDGTAQHIKRSASCIFPPCVCACVCVNLLPYFQQMPVTANVVIFTLENEKLRLPRASLVTAVVKAKKGREID